MKSDIITPHKVMVVILIQEYFNKDPQTPWLPKYRKKFGKLVLRLIQNSDLPYESLHNLIKSDPFCLHPQHVANFDKYMAGLVSGENREALSDLNQNLDKLVISEYGKPPQIHPSSVVSLFLRRFMVTLDRMSLFEVAQLYEAICEYYCPRAIPAAVDEDVSDVMDFTEPNQQIEACRREFRRWSRRQIELFIGQQFHKLEHNETEAMDIKSLQATINEIIEDNPNYSAAFLLDYLNSLRSADVFNGLEKIHRCFDVTDQRNIITKPGKGYQYYILNLALFNARFNHRQLALYCLRESIMLAQEYGDRHCLELAEDWRQYLEHSNLARRSLTDHPTPFQSNISSQLIAKALSLNGGCIRMALKIISQHGFMNFQQSLMVATATALKSAIMSQHGLHELSVLNSQLLLNCPIKSYGTKLNGESLCLSLLTVASWMSLQGEYDQAAVILQVSKEQHSTTKLGKSIAIAELQISIDQSIVAKRWKDATDYCYILQTYDPALKDLNLANVMLQRQNYPLAMHIADLLLTKPITPSIRIRATIIKIQIMIASQRDTNFEVLNLVINTLNSAKLHQLYHEIGKLEMLLTEVLLLLECPRRAKIFVGRAIAKLQANGSIFDRAKVLFLSVRCLMAVTEDPKKRLSLMDTVAKPLVEWSIATYRRLGCTAELKDIYTRMAEFYHGVGAVETRNRYAFKFKQLVLKHPTPGEVM